MKDYTSPDYTEEDHHATEPEEVLKSPIAKIQARIKRYEALEKRYETTSFNSIAIELKGVLADLGEE